MNSKDASLRYPNRRRVVQVLVGGVAAAALLPSLTRAEGTKLRVGTYGGSYKDEIDKFVGAPLKPQGIEVEYVLDSPSGNLAKLIAARGRALPFDAMEGAPQLLAKMVDAGMLAEVDYSAVPNAASLPAVARGKYNPLTYGVLSGIVYNEEKFKEAGIAPPKTYAELADPKLAGHVAFPDVAHSAHFPAVVGLAQEAGGDETSLEKAVPMINKIKPAYYFDSSTKLATKFGTGEIWAAPWSAGWGVRLKRGGLPIAISYQDYGTNRGTFWPNEFYIIKGSDNGAAATAFLNQYLSEDAQYGIGLNNGHLPMNKAARDRLGASTDIVKDFLLFTDADVDNMRIIAWNEIDLPKWQDVWSRQIER